MSKAKKHHLRTFKVHFATDGIDGTRNATLYSKRGPLVVTRNVNEGGSGYVVTHAVSGYAVARLPKLAQARQVLKGLLPLTDWSQGVQALTHNADLYAQVHAVLESVIPTQR